MSAVITSPRPRELHALDTDYVVATYSFTEMPGLVVPSSVDVSARSAARMERRPASPNRSGER